MKKNYILILFSLLVQAAYSQHIYREISLPDLMKRYQRDPSKMVIVDVRSDAEYYDTSSRFKSGNIGRIKGITHVDFFHLQEKKEELKPFEQFKDKEIYLICSHSYRSRNVSNALLKNGFTNVNNVQGGMTEWYRRYEDLLPYRNALETSIRYSNFSAAQLWDLYKRNSEFLLIGVNIIPGTFYDSANQRLLNILPAFKNAVLFSPGDSSKVLDLAIKNAGKPIVIFGGYSYGAAEMADWLAGKGISNVNYLVGGLNYYLEYIANSNLLNQAPVSLLTKSPLRFISSGYLCDQLANKYRTIIIDLRHDTLFKKINEGIKSDYTHFKNSSSFPSTKSVAEFEKTFPDKEPQYIMVSRYGNEGMELAEELANRGYHINWLLGGIARFDWYTINMEGFRCSDLLLRPATVRP